MEQPEFHVLLLAGRFEVRGSCAYTLRLAEHLRASDLRARIITPDARLLDSTQRAELGVKECRHLQLPVWGGVVQHLLERELERDPPDLIHIQSRHMLPLGTWLARELKRPFILTVHDNLQPNERLHFDPTWGRQVIAVSESVRADLLERSNITPELLTVIYSGVEASADRIGLPVLDPGHVPVIGTAGPLEAVKGIPFFLGAAARVLETKKDVEFLISGSGPEEGNLRRLARELGLADRVTFVPNMRDFSASLEAMDVFSLPSLQQGLGTIMLQAMVMGKPVIASAVGGVYSVIRNEVTGLVVPPSDSQKLAEAMLQFLDDPEFARRIGRAGQQMVQEEFCVERMVSQTVELYRRLLKEQPVAVPV